MFDLIKVEPRRVGQLIFRMVLLTYSQTYYTGRGIVILRLFLLTNNNPILFCFFVHWSYFL